MKLRVLAVAISLFAFLSPSANAQYDGSFTSIYHYEAWISKTHAKHRKHKRIYKKHRTSRRSKITGYSGGPSLGGIISTLQAKCGAKVISASRPGSVTPGGMRSCHATGQAVDMTGNYTCMYAVLRSWPGGYTLDSGRCKHIHISSCKMEWGMRFNHRSC